MWPCAVSLTALPKLPWGALVPLPARRSCFAAVAAATVGASPASSAGPATAAAANMQCGACAVLLMVQLQPVVVHFLQARCSNLLPSYGVIAESRCAGALSQPQVTVNFDATTDHAIYGGASTNGLTFQYGQPAPNPSFAVNQYGNPALAVSLPNYMRVCYVITPQSPTVPVTISATTGTFALLSSLLC